MGRELAKKSVGIEKDGSPRTTLSLSLFPYRLVSNSHFQGPI